MRSISPRLQEREPLRFPAAPFDVKAPPVDAQPPSVVALGHSANSEQSGVDNPRPIDRQAPRKTPGQADRRLSSCEQCRAGSIKASVAGSEAGTAQAGAPGGLTLGELAADSMQRGKTGSSATRAVVLRDSARPLVLRARWMRRLATIASSRSPCAACASAKLLRVRGYVPVVLPSAFSRIASARSNSGSASAYRPCSA
jgi:hypothetical protein